jgi:SAM-dependent methyltransferase
MHFYSGLLVYFCSGVDKPGCPMNLQLGAGLTAAWMLAFAVWGEAIAIAADLACGTGFWLRQQGVQLIDGVDITREMLEIARAKGVYRHLDCNDVSRTELPSASYGLCTLVLADEHLADLTPVYLHRDARPYVIGLWAASACGRSLSRSAELARVGVGSVGLVIGRS